MRGRDKGLREGASIRFFFKSGRSILERHNLKIETNRLSLLVVRRLIGWTDQFGSDRIRVSSATDF